MSATLRMLGPLIYFGRRFEEGELLSADDEIGQTIQVLFPDRVAAVARDYLSEPTDYLSLPLHYLRARRF